MQRHEGAEETGKERARQVEKRRLFHERLARERRHDPVAALQDVMNEAEAVGLVRLPRIATEKPGGEPHGDEQGERGALAIFGG